MQCADAAGLRDRAQHASVGEEAGGKSKTLAKRRLKKAGKRVLQSSKAHRDRARHDTHKFRVVESRFMQQGPGLGENEVGSRQR
jgi:hypothetical protein